MADKPHGRGWSANLFIWLGVVALAVLVGGIGLWSIGTTIAGAVIAPGTIQVETNRQVVQHPQGGVVGEIVAQDGDRVEAGDVVLKLDSTFLRSELAIAEGQLNEILARKARLEAERDQRDDIIPSDELREAVAKSAEVQDLFDGQTRLFEARRETLAREREQLAEQIAQAGNQIDGLQAQLDAYFEQQALVAKELEDSQSLLTRGLTQASRVSELQRENANISGQIGNLEASIAQLHGQIAALEIERLKLVTTRREAAISELRDLRYMEIELREQRLSARETLFRMDVRSPVSGIVYDSQVFAEHAVVSPAEPIMYVIPQDRPLVVSARLPSIHIDQAYIGQKATLRFTAFDQRQTPEIVAQVSNLSADAFTDETTGATFYQVELIPNPGELDKLGDRRLLPGMPVESYLRTTDRTPLSYLVKPLTDYFYRAFREG